MGSINCKLDKIYQLYPRTLIIAIYLKRPHVIHVTLHLTMLPTALMSVCVLLWWDCHTVSSQISPNVKNVLMIIVDDFRPEISVYTDTDDALYPGKTVMGLSHCVCDNCGLVGSTLAL